MLITSSPTEHRRGQGTGVGAAGSHRSQSQRKREGSTEGPIRADQGNRPRARAAQERGGHPAFQSSHVGHGEMAAGNFHFSRSEVSNDVF